jgi:hypothetical protein
VRGLLAELPRKNCWTIAEHAGDPSPDGMQHLLARAMGDEDKVRDDLRDYVVEHLGDPQAVLVVDEIRDLKKGTTTVGVNRQYTGTAGRVENAQVAVYLVYASSRGPAVIDRELYLPRSWTDDPRAPAGSRRPRSGRVCDQASPGHGDAVPRAGGPPDRLCAGGRRRPPRPGRWHQPARRRPAPPRSTAGVLAKVLGTRTVDA